MITPDMTIRQVMEMDMSGDRRVVPIFMSFGMHCLFCPHSSAESLAEASKVHGVDVNELVAKLNEYFEGSKK